MGLIGPVTFHTERKPQAFNPYLPSYEYIPDGEPHVFGDRVYIYGSHDAFDGELYCMKDYVCYSAPVTDLTDWRFEGTIYEKKQDPRNEDGSHCLWAPDVTKGLDGRYYLYYCLDVLPEIGVAVCDTPAGKYEYLGMVRHEDGSILGRREGDFTQFDPGIFIDEDKTIYLYSGNAARVMDDKENKSSQVMRLKKDMLTIEGEVKPLIPSIFNSAGTGFEGHEFFEASSVRKIGETYYFVYSDIRSSSLCYATSSRPDSDYAFGRVLVDICDIGMEGRNAPVNFPGNTHGGIEFINGKWYLFYHRQTNHTQYSRQGCAEEIRILSNGHIPQVEVTSCGLNGGPLQGIGRYEARIACNLWGKHGVAVLRKKEETSKYPYFTQDGEDRECCPNQYIANMRDGAVAGFKYFSFYHREKDYKITVRIRGNADGRLLVMNEPEGEACAKILIKTESNEKKTWRAFTGEAHIPDGVHALFFCYEGEGSIDFLDFELA
nr:family 43 glycosylhydrolase [Konateibacter massiliensis]